MPRFPTIPKVKTHCDNKKNGGNKLKPLETIAFGLFQ